MFQGGVPLLYTEKAVVLSLNLAYAIHPYLCGNSTNEDVVYDGKGKKPR